MWGIRKGQGRPGTDIFPTFLSVNGIMNPQARRNYLPLYSIFALGCIDRKGFERDFRPQRFAMNSTVKCEPSSESVARNQVGFLSNGITRYISFCHPADLVVESSLLVHLYLDTRWPIRVGDRTKIDCVCY